MDFRLAKEIYGNVWCIDPITFIQLHKTLDFFNNGGKLEKPQQKLNSFGILCNDVFTPSEINYEEKYNRGIPENSIAVYNIDSVITKHGGMSHYGMVEIGQQFQQMEENDKVIGHIFNIESGGGSANAIKYIRDFSNKETRNKPLVTFYEDINASAAYYISSDSDWIIANSKDSLVGSIGTMIELEGYKSETEDSNGVRHLRIYADPSFNKNKDFEEAINNFNVELIKKEILNPHAEEFIKDIENNRPNVTTIQKSGKIFRSKDALGTLIDQIGNFQDAIDKVKELSGIKTTNTLNEGNNNNNQNYTNMTKEEFKIANPEAYNEIVNEGVTQERDRVEAYLVFNDTSPEKVKAGIESGKPLSQKAMAEFSKEMMAGEKLKSIEEENVTELNTELEASSEADLKAKETAEILDKAFNKKNK